MGIRTKYILTVLAIGIILGCIETYAFKIELSIVHHIINGSVCVLIVWISPLKKMVDQISRNPI
jgi:hypothetical protein